VEFSLVRKLAAVIAAFVVVVPLCARIAAGTDVPRPRAGWRDDYRRPASPPYPEDDPYTSAKAALGAALFFDPVLSGSRTMACATCHQPGLGWTNSQPHAIGDLQKPMSLRAPTLLDVAWVPILGWDGKFPDIEAVTFRAIAGEANMDLPATEALERLSASPAYARRFEAAFGPGPITKQQVEEALATFERSIASGTAPFDRWVDGDDNAVSDSAKRGFALFEGKAHCASCHSGWAFTDYSFQDVGTATGDDLGRAALFPTSVALRYAFKVPTLRDVALRAPYMHDGSLPDLEAVIDHYDTGGIDRPSRSPKIKPLGLTQDEKADLIAFLKTLTGDSHTAVYALQPR
jgi:cytochrome c peroxidase